MAQTTLADLNDVIKELWPQNRLDNLAFGETPFLAVVNKETSFNEDIKHIVLQYGNPQGRSATFATAQANNSASQFADWQLTRVSDYAVGTLAGELLEATKGKGRGAALVDALDNAIEGSMTELARSLHKSLFGDGSGKLGQSNGAGGAFASPTFTLTNVEDVASFQKNMTVVLSPNADGTGIRAGKEVIAAVDRDAGTITSTSANWNTVILTALNDDFVYVEGDATKMVTGLSGWIPQAAPGAALFFGVDRTSDVVSLAGIRYDGSADGTKKEALENAAGRLMREGNGAKPDTILMNPVDAQKLNIELGSQRVYEDVLGQSSSGKAVDFGFKAVTMATMRGNMKVLPDYQCPIGKAYMLDMSTWTFHSLGGAPRLLGEDGLKILRSATEDGYEYRAGYRGNLVCSAPGRNVLVTLP